MKCPVWRDSDATAIRPRIGFIAPRQTRLITFVGPREGVYSVESLDLKGFRGKPVQNTLFKQERKTDHVALVFPGYGYRCFGPVIYYPSLVLLSAGADVLWVEYAYDREPEYPSMLPAERREWRLSDANAAVKAVLEKHTYERFTLVGKSIGTQVVGDLLSEERRLNSARAIWLTPLLYDERLRNQLERLSNQSLLVSGSADSAYDPEFALKLERRSNITFLLLEGVDHGLEVRGDPLQSLEALRRLTEQTLNFLTQ